MICSPRVNLRGTRENFFARNPSAEGVRKKMKTTLTLALSGTVCLTLVLAAPVAAQLAQQANTPQQFLLKVTNDDYAEIQLGKLALKNAQSDEVKKFAQQMVD